MTTANQINLSKWQSKALQDNSFASLFHGGRGSGKSFALVLDLYLEASKYPGTRWALLCNSFKQLEEITHKTLVDLLDMIGQPYSYNASSRRLSLPNGSTIHELTFDRPTNLLKGMEYDGVYIDEADGNLTTEEKYNTVVACARRKGRLDNGIPVEGRRIRVSCNPVSPGHWIARRFFTERPDNHSLYTPSTYDNVENLPEDYIPQLEQAHPPGSSSHKRYMLAQLVSMEGTTYQEFVDNLDDFLFEPSDLPKTDTWLYSMDLGFNDPTVMLEGTIGPGGVLYITNEYYQSGLDPEQHLPALLDMYKEGWPVFSDHSATQHAFYKRKGINMIKAYKEVDAGIQLVRNRIHMRSIKISTRCRNLIREMCNYRIKSLPSGKEVPEHDFSHGPDSTRYMIAGLDRRSIFS